MHWPRWTGANCPPLRLPPGGSEISAAAATASASPSATPPLGQAGRRTNQRQSASAGRRDFEHDPGNRPSDETYYADARQLGARQMADGLARSARLGWTVAAVAVAIASWRRWR